MIIHAYRIYMRSYILFNEHHNMFTIRPTTQEDIELIKTVDTHYTIHKKKHTQAIQAWNHFSAWKNHTMVWDIIVDDGLYGKRFIWLLHTHPLFRRQGIATKLIKFAEQQCTQDKIFISTQQSNMQMRKLLSKLEYLPCWYINYINEDNNDDELFFYKPFSCTM